MCILCNQFSSLKKTTFITFISRERIVVSIKEPLNCINLLLKCFADIRSHYMVLKCFHFVQLDGHEIKKGKKLKVNISIANQRLFVGNIPKSKTKEEILEEFSKKTGKFPFRSLPILLQFLPYELGEIEFNGAWTIIEVNTWFFIHD